MFKKKITSRKLDKHQRKAIDSLLCFDTLEKESFMILKDYKLNTIPSPLKHIKHILYKKNQKHVFRV